MNKYLIFKNKKFRSKFEQNRMHYYAVHSLLLDSSLSNKVKFKIMLLKQDERNQNGSSLIKNRCIKSNYARSVLRLTHLAKKEFKDANNLGLLTGFKKSSW